VTSLLAEGVNCVIVVDNASQDTSLLELSSALASENRLQIIVNRQNVGFAKACNFGARASSGRYLLFFNPDSKMETFALRRMLDVLEVHPDVGMVGGQLIYPDGTEQGGGRRAIPTPWRSFVRAFGLYRFAQRYPRLFFDFHLHKHLLPDQPIEVEAISGACMLVRREAMDTVGEWDEQYFLHCEDLDWCMRFRQAGWKIMFVPNARIIHDKGTCSRSRPIFVEWHKHKGMMRFYRKFFSQKYLGLFMLPVALGVWLHFAALAAYHAASRLKRLLGRA